MQENEKTPETKQSQSKPFVFNAYFSIHNPAPVEAADLGDGIEKVYGWDVIDGKVEIVYKGTRCPEEDIQAAKMETITEMLDRMAGNTPLQKVQNAVNAGLFPANAPGSDAKYCDLTGVPASVVEAQELIRKGNAAASSLPSDITKGETDLEKILALLTTEQLEAYIASKKSSSEKKEGDN